MVKYLKIFNLEYIWNVFTAFVDLLYLTLTIIQNWVVSGYWENWFGQWLKIVISILPFLFYFISTHFLKYFHKFYRNRTIYLNIQDNKRKLIILKRSNIEINIILISLFNHKIMIFLHTWTPLLQITLS